MTNRIIIDLDGTITIDDKDTSYQDKKADKKVVEKLREYKENGYIITIMTARNMRTFKGNIGEINKHTLPLIIDWLKFENVPYDEIIVGKPWCGPEGFYIDDRSIRPSEFCDLTQNEIKKLLKKENENEN